MKLTTNVFTFNWDHITLYMFKIKILLMYLGGNGLLSDEKKIKECNSFSS